LIFKKFGIHTNLLKINFKDYKLKVKNAEISIKQLKLCQVTFEGKKEFWYFLKRCPFEHFN